MRSGHNRLVWVTVAMLAAALPAQPQNLIVNGSFEEPRIDGSSANSLPVPGWSAYALTTSVAANLRILRQVTATTFVGLTGQDGSQWVQLDNMANMAIFQDISTIPNQRYRLTFKYANRPIDDRGNPRAPSSAVRVLWNGTAQGSVTTTEPTFIAASMEVVGAGLTSRLQFEAAGTSDDLGDWIDDVALVPIPAPGSTAGYSYILPHWAQHQELDALGRPAGSIWSTIINIINPTSIDSEVEYTVYRQSGERLDPRLNRFALPALQSRVVEFTGISGTPLIIGWVQVTGSTQLRVSEIFSSSAPGRSTYEAAVLNAPPTDRVVAPFDNTTPFVSSLAVVNPTADTVTVNIAYRSPEGTVIAIPSGFALTPRRQIAVVLPTENPVLSGRRGTVEITGRNTVTNAPAPISAVGFRFNGLVFATLPY